jgi:hypothetical protein
LKFNDGHRSPTNISVSLLTQHSFFPPPFLSNLVCSGQEICNHSALHSVEGEGKKLAVQGGWKVSRFGVVTQAYVATLMRRTASQQGENTLLAIKEIEKWKNFVFSGSFHLSLARLFGYKLRQRPRIRVEVPQLQLPVMFE